MQTQGRLLQLEVDSRGQAPAGGWSFLAHGERGGMWEPCVGTGGDEPACLPPGDQEGRAERPSGAPGKMLRVQLPMRVWSQRWVDEQSRCRVNSPGESSGERERTKGICFL